MPRYIEQMVSEQISRSELSRRRENENGKPCERSVVTISRRMGSGARIIAQKLADELGWSLWDKELVNAIAENAHVSGKVAREFDEHTISEIELFARGMFGDQERAGFIYPRHLARAVKTIAKIGNAIILGRGANFILPDALNIRIDASDARRIDNMMNYEDMRRDDATAKLHDSDRERRHFVERVFGRERVESAVYDLTIWMDEFTNDDAVQIILAAIKARCGRK
jgi:cytidylate kinase